MDAARTGRTEVSVCGEMANDEKYLPFLIGIGVRILSLDPLYLPRVQRAIPRIHLEGAARLAQEVLAQTRVEAIGRSLEEYQKTSLGGRGQTIAS
jgi:phosphoenolpyruvate-protein kinase (PTS system EI component)